jgi:hypothetical protein
MMSNKQLSLNKAITTCLLTVPLACLTAPVFAEPGGSGGNKGGGNPIEECKEHGASYFAKYDWEGKYVRSDDSKGDVVIKGDASRGKWESKTAIGVMIVKGGTLRDPKTYSPAENGGEFDNKRIKNKDISHITFCTKTGEGSVSPPADGEDIPPAPLEPPAPTKLLATGVNLTATPNGTGGVDLELTTFAEPDTAALLILRGDLRENGGTEIDVACSFASGGSPYTCTDDVAADTYRAAEVEYDGSFIIYDEVTQE